MNTRRIVFCIVLICAFALPALAAPKVIPGGNSIGVMVASDGLIVIGNSDLGNVASPARAAGIRAGDRILSVDGERVVGAEHLAYLTGLGNELLIGYARGDKLLEARVSPLPDPRDGKFRLGLWVRDGAAGVGTLSFYAPDSLRYAALGHPVTDADTGDIITVDTGLVYASEVVGIKAGQSGAPGEVLGDFDASDPPIGEVALNNEFGVFGDLFRPVGSELYPEGLEISEPGDVTPGPASIITTLTDGEPREYSCEILKAARQSSPATRGLTIRVTDPRLIEAAGGIAQGMSGSPIIQGGRLAGVVTHVYVSDPSRGYGVYSKWMYDEMELNGSSR